MLLLKIYKRHRNKIQYTGYGRALPFIKHTEINPPPAFQSVITLEHTSLHFYGDNN